MKRARRPASPRTLLRRLSQLYPEPRCELNYRNPLELLIATILSAQCTDERVNLVTADLFRKYQTPADYLAVPQEELERDIHSTGFYRNKARNIQGACRRLLEAYGGEVPSTMDELLTLPGVARKTANVVLGNIFEKNEGIAVDTHVTRLSGLLGLSLQSDPVKIERDLMAAFPRRSWTALSHMLILHGRRVCVARRPRCGECALADLCPAARVEDSAGRGFRAEKARYHNGSSESLQDAEGEPNPSGGGDEGREVSHDATGLRSMTPCEHGETLTPRG